MTKQQEWHWRGAYPRCACEMGAEAKGEGPPPPPLLPVRCPQCDEIVKQKPASQVRSVGEEVVRCCRGSSGGSSRG